MTIDSGVALRILECAAGAGNVAKSHDPCSVHFDGEVQHVLRVFEYTRNLDRKPAFAGVQRAGRDETVVSRHQVIEILLLEPVTLHRQWVNHDLENFLAIAPHIDLEYTGNAFDIVFQVARQTYQCPFLNFARNVDDQHRVHFRKFYFVYPRFFGVFG